MGKRDKTHCRLRTLGWHDVTCQYNDIIISWEGAQGQKTPSVYGLWKGLSSLVSAVLWSSEEMIALKVGGIEAAFCGGSHLSCKYFCENLMATFWVTILEFRWRSKNKFVRFPASCFSLLPEGPFHLKPFIPPYFFSLLKTTDGNSFILCIK